MQEIGIMNIAIKKLNKNAQLPTKGSKEAAGYDLYGVNTDFVFIHPHTTVTVGTGLSIELLPGTFAAIVARSGIATKRGLRPANCMGIIDSDYRGEIIVALHNDTDTVQNIKPHERIAQLIIFPSLNVSFKETNSLSETERGNDGFGSTGTQ